MIKYFLLFFCIFSKVSGKEYDVIVIGSGISGICISTCTANAGKATIVGKANSVHGAYQSGIDAAQVS